MGWIMLLSTICRFIDNTLLDYSRLSRRPKRPKETEETRVFNIHATKGEALSLYTFYEGRVQTTKSILVGILRGFFHCKSLYFWNMYLRKALSHGETLLR